MAAARRWQLEAEPGGGRWCPCASIAADAAIAPGGCERRTFQTTGKSTRRSQSGLRCSRTRRRSQWRCPESNSAGRSERWPSWMTQASDDHVMDPITTALIVAIVIFAGTIASLEAGFRWGRRDSAAHEGLGAIEASAFALLGLLLGFSFAGAMSRLDAKRSSIVEEANAIGTAYRRVDILPADAQPPIRQAFKRLIEARISAYERRLDPETADRAL